MEAWSVFAMLALVFFLGNIGQAVALRHQRIERQRERSIRHEAERQLRLCEFTLQDQQKSDTEKVVEMYDQLGLSRGPLLFDTSHSDR